MSPDQKCQSDTVIELLFMLLVLLLFFTLALGHLRGLLFPLILSDRDIFPMYAPLSVRECVQIIKVT